MRASWNWVGRLVGVSLMAGAAVGVIGVTPASAATPPLKVVIEFDGTGTFSATNGAGTDTPEHADVDLSWSTTYAGDLQSDGSIANLQATGAAASGEVTQTTAAPPGTFHFTSSGLDAADCPGLPLPLAPGAPAPVATDENGTLTLQSVTAVDQNDETGQVSCMGTDPYGNQVDLSQNATNLGGAFGPSLPDVLSARITLPPDALRNGTFSKAVSNSDAPQQLPGSCADQFGLPEGQCPMSLSWSGTIKISVPCGQVTFSEGDAPPVGALFNPGDIISTGAKSRVEITLPDGAVVRLGPSSKLQCDHQETFHENPRSVTDSLHLLLGSMWGAISGALGHDFEMDYGSVHAMGGVRGSAFTASLHGGRLLLHVIEGTGWFKANGRPEYDFPAGDGILIDPEYGDYTLTTNWPAADQGLVPAAQLPPKLSSVRLTGSGRGLTLRFKLNRNAAVTVHVQRGKRRVMQRKVNAHRGAGSIKLGALPRGRYTLSVFAAAQKRTTAAQKTFRVP